MSIYAHLSPDVRYKLYSPLASPGEKVSPYDTYIPIFACQSSAYLDLGSSQAPHVPAERTPLPAERPAERTPLPAERPAERTPLPADYWARHT